MSAQFHLTVLTQDTQLAQAVSNGGEPLRVLCREEVEEFDRFMRENEPNWSGGLAIWEKQILATYLYQKIRGRIEPPARAPNDPPQEGANGEA